MKYDTLKFAKSLEAVGMDREHAAAIAEAVAAGDTSEMATRTDIEALRSDVERMKAELYRAMAFQTFALFAAMVGLKIFG
jgi:hypothetical protein